MLNWRPFETGRGTGQRFANLKSIPHPTLVVNGIYDEINACQNSYWLSANLPNTVLLTYPCRFQATARCFNFASSSRGKRRHSCLPTQSSRPIELSPSFRRVSE